MLNIKFVITLVLLSFTSFLFGQSNNGFVYATTNTDGSAVWLKWFANYSIEQGSTVWRRGPNSDWERLTDEPIKMVSKDVSLPEGDENEIALLMAQEYAQENLDTIPAVLELIYAVEMVRNQKFCEYIGRFYEDRTAQYGETYEYKITIGDSERLIGRSEPIIALAHRPIEPVQEVKWEADEDIDTLLRMGWLPEDARYFGVNIYRTEPETEDQRLLNNLYIFPSLKGGENAVNKEFQDWFYSNDNHKMDETYVYELEAVDFFGRPGKRTEPIEIVMEDKTPPSLPLDWELTKSAAKEVYIHWINSDDDRLEAYNIYQRKADGESVLINEEPISANLDSYTHSVENYGSYFYVIETVSKNG